MAKKATKKGAPRAQDAHREAKKEAHDGPKEKPTEPINAEPPEELVQSPPQWSVHAFVRNENKGPNAKRTPVAQLKFGDTVVHQLEGVVAEDALRAAAKDFNARNYVPDLSKPNYFKKRPKQDAFLWDGKGERPFTK